MNLELARSPSRKFRRALIVLLFAGLAAGGSTPGFSGVMWLSGNFSVSPTGAANYAVPIALPPGTAGVVPTLSLEYSSQGDNGLVGVGWSLSGLPSISRCPRTKVQDGTAGVVNFDLNDRYCLDGQRLVTISGTYGADGTQYRTEVEGFSKVISHGTAGNGPAWFEVHTKSGQIMEFGNTIDSRNLAQGKASVRVWAVNKVSDTKANYFSATYINDTTNGQFYPTRIDYTGNSSASVAPYNSVQFIYGSRSDIVPRYQAGSLSQSTVVLTDIKTYAGSSLVADYKLSYQISATTARSRLTSLQVCDGSASPNCLPPTSFSWLDVAGSNFASVLSYSPGTVFNTTGANIYRAPGTYGALAYGPGLISLDLNGDGKTDLIQQYNYNGLLTFIMFISNGDGTFVHVNWATGNAFDSMTGARGPGLIAADLNGDGKSDIVQQWNNNGTLYVVAYLSKGDGTFTQVTQNLANGFESSGDGPGLIAMDLDGDGRSDLLQQWNNAGSLYFFTYLSNGNGTFTGQVVNALNGFNSMGAGSGPGLLPVDIDGDGKTDLIQQWNYNGTLYLIPYLSKGDGTLVALATQNSNNGFGSSGSGPGLIPMDVNGDGKTDLVQPWNVGGTLYFIVHLSKGDGTFSVRGGFNEHNGFDSMGSGNGPGLIPVDLDGDGRTDLVQQWNNNSTFYYFLYYSNGDGTFRVVGGINSGNGFGSSSTTLTPGLIPVDTAGLGRTGLLQQWNYNGNLTLFLYTPSSVAPDLLSAVTEGLGRTTSLSYSRLTSSSAYAKDSTSTFPQLDLQVPMSVVARVDMSNGVGGTYGSSYSYAGAKADLSGRGFLGFRQMTIKDLQTNIVDTTHYRQDFPYIGLVASTSRVVGSQTLGQSTNTYQFSNASSAASVSAPSITSAPYRVSLSQNVSSGADMDGSALPTVTTSNQYDAYLNATQVVVATPDGFSKTTTNTYSNDSSLWYLGRLTRATVSNVSP